MKDESKSIKRNLVEALFIVVIGIALIGFVMSVTGCATYNDRIAPYIPNVKIEGNVGGEGFGASIGFDSKWTGNKRERAITIGPDVDVDKLKEELDSEG